MGRDAVGWDRGAVVGAKPDARPWGRGSGGDTAEDVCAGPDAPGRKGRELPAARARGF